MKRPTLPKGTIPSGATHFYFDPKRTEDASNPWRRLDSGTTWYMFRGDEWIRISGSRSYNFIAIAGTLPGGLFYQAPEDVETLRDKFAMRAPVTFEMAIETFESLTEDERNRTTVFNVLAMLRFGYADAMMRARG